MNAGPPNPARSSSVNHEIARTIDECCDRFEADWLEGRCPRIEDFLVEYDSVDRSELLQELLTAEAQIRIDAGESPELSEYLSRFPSEKQTVERIFASRTVELNTTPHDIFEDDAILAVGEVRDEGQRPRFGNYEIIREIARGGMGIVYEARDTSLNRHVALKVIRSGQFAGVEEQQRFMNEAASAARLDHTGIVQIYEVGEHENRRFLAMAYVRGETLSDALSEGPLSSREVGKLVESLADAMGYAHSLGIVHRDLKPSNILLDKKKRPKITDFGLAKDVDQDSSLTATGQILGTPSYMPPEQASGRLEQVDAQSDLYSLGAILYFCLTGRPPFQAASTFAIIRQVLYEEPVRPRKLNPEVDVDLETICLKCLEKDRSRRYDDANALAEDLRCYLDGRPVQARPISTTRRTIKWIRRWPVTSALIATVVLTGVAGISGVLWQWQQAEEARSLAAAKALRESIERGRAVDAQTRAEEAKEEATRRQMEADRVAARLASERGLQLGNAGKTDLALLWFARSLELAIRGQDPALENAARINLSLWRANLSPPRKTIELVKSIEDLEFLPDGKRLLVGSKNSPSRLWDMETVEPTGPLFVERSLFSGIVSRFRTVWDTDVSADGKLAVIGDADGKVRVWDLETHEMIGAVMSPGGTNIWSVKFNRDGTRFLTGGTQAMREWDVATSQPIGEPYPHDNNYVVITRYAVDESIKLSIGRKAVLWRGYEQTTIPDTDFVKAGEFALDSKLIVLGNIRGHLMFFDTETLAPAGPTLILDSEIHTIAVSPDGSAALVGCKDGLVRIYDLNSFEPIGPSFWHPEPVEAITFSPNGKSILVGGTGGQVISWELPRTNRLATLLDRDEAVEEIVFSPKGRPMVAFGPAVSRVGRRGRVSTTPKSQYLSTIRSADFSPDGRYFVSASNDRIIRLWDTRGWNVIHESIETSPRPSGKRLAQVAFTDDGQEIVSVNVGSKINRWSVPSLERKDRVSARMDDAVIAQLSPDVQLLAQGSKDGRVEIIHVSDGEPYGELLNQSDWVTSICFFDDQRRIAIGCRDGTVRIWDMLEGVQVAPMLQLEASVRSLDLNASNTILLTGCSDQSAQTWDIATGLQVGNDMRHSATVTDVQWRQDSETIVSASIDGTVVEWSCKIEPMTGSPREISDLLAEQLGLRLDEKGVVLRLKETTE